MRHTHPPVHRIEHFMERDTYMSPAEAKNAPVDQLPWEIVSAGLVIYDTIQSIPILVATLCLGQARSMASLLAAGTPDQRRALPNSRIMIHQPFGGFLGQASDIAIHAKEILKIYSCRTSSALSPPPRWPCRVAATGSYPFSTRSGSCASAVTDDTACTVLLKLLSLAKNNRTKPVHLLINSPGGIVSAGLAIYDTIQSIPTPVATLCLGEAASIASLLLTAGAPGQCRALPNSCIMIHQPSGGFWARTSLSRLMLLAEGAAEAAGSVRQRKILLAEAAAGSVS
uniref:ATP-dependent Clp protease proteolytic subunit n=1 Tax=Ananas comosus var. bracteatus TaxID=296719 RepID=A0A6V7PWU0_ANACO|nr:unnamed protein product [Ananas comosus var. bracteatus]